MRTDETASLADAVQDLASAVDSALRGGVDHGRVLEDSPEAEQDPFAVGAARVLGADLLAPHLLAGHATDPRGIALARAALRDHPPTNDSSTVSGWSHWGLTRALHTAESTVDVLGGGAEPESGWVDAEAWPSLTYRLATLSALAHPRSPSGLLARVAQRPEDVARGFVRALRRRDWLQAAGAGRWLAAVPGCPPSLGLDAGLRFLRHAGGDDARVRLRVSAAQLLRGTE